MVSPIDNNARHVGAGQFNVAIGEALFASTLATVTLTGQVASGRLSHNDAAAMLDGATLVLERHRGTDSETAAAVDYARTRVSALMTLLHDLHLNSQPLTADLQR